MRFSKKLFVIFGISFASNLVWENFHSLLYNAFMGGHITEWVLLVSALVDALIILFITLPFVLNSKFKKYDWLIFLIGIMIGILIEKFALYAGWWTYNAYMPIVPFFSVGLTPIFQLGLLGYISFKIEENCLSDIINK